MTNPPPDVPETSPERYVGAEAEMASALAASGYTPEEITEAIEADRATIDRLVDVLVQRLTEGEEPC